MTIKVSYYFGAIIFFILFYWIANTFICKEKKHGTLFYIFIVLNGLLMLASIGLGFLVVLGGESYIGILSILSGSFLAWMLYGLFYWKKTAYYALIAFAVVLFLSDLAAASQYPDASIARGTFTLGLVFGAKSKFLNGDKKKEKGEKLPPFMKRLN